MRPTIILVMVAALVVSLATGLTRANDDPITTANTDITSGSQPIFIDAPELEWFDLDPENAPGVRLATLWGDPGGGAFGAYMSLPAGFDAPLHTHTHPMKVVFVSGTYIQAPDGEPAVHQGRRVRTRVEGTGTFNKEHTVRLRIRYSRAAASSTTLVHEPIATAKQTHEPANTPTTTPTSSAV